MTAIRCERPTPGSLVHIDVRRVSGTLDGGGWRANGRHAGFTWARTKARIGFDFVYSLIDDHVRLAYCEIILDEQGTTCVGVLRRAATIHR